VSEVAEQQAEDRIFSRRRRLRRLKVVVLTVLALLLFGVVAVIVAYAATAVPSPNALADAQTSIVYYADGKSELDRISDVNRESVALSKVPVDVQRAMLAAEDRDFYQNNGVSIRGTVRALVNDLRGGPRQGGSTITQQYVKNYFLDSDQTISRKARELLIAVKIDSQMSKSHILENYLNTIYFGRGAYGIQTASRAYFGKDVSRLTLSEGALLAAVVRGPSLYDPAQGSQAKARATGRIGYVLDAMVNKGWVSPERRAAATLPATTAVPTRRSTAGTTGYLTAMVKSELKGSLKLTDDDIDRGGLRVVTTIDKASQAAAVRAVAEQTPTGRNTSHLQAGLAAIKPGDGAVVALYGGKDYGKNQFNTATQAHLQGGSTFKVFGLLAAMRQDISTKTTFSGRSPQYFPEFAGVANPRGKVTNSSNEQFGSIDLRRALADSVNTVFAQLNIKVSPADTRRAAIDAGLPKETPGLGDNYTNILGTASPRVIDMANAYATVAAQGVRATPYLIKRVTSRGGSIDYTVKKQLSPAFDKDQTADVTDAMQQVVRVGTGHNASLGARPVAGKTGTTTGNKAIWFDGFIPGLATAVGMFNEVDGKTTSMVNVGGYSQLFGGTIPAKIWAAFMRDAVRGDKIEGFPARAGIGDDKLPPPPITTTATTATTSTTATTATSTPPPSSTPPSTSSTTSTPTSTTTASTTSTSTTTSMSTTTSSTTTQTTTQSTTRTTTRSTTRTTTRSSTTTRSHTTTPGPSRTTARTRTHSRASASADGVGSSP
jgi:membrane peptidoglycan carboxypeptidase